MTLLLSYDLSVQQYDVCRFVGVQAYFADRAVQPLGDVCRTAKFGLQPLYGAAPVAEFFIFPGEAPRHFASQHIGFADGRRKVKDALCYSVFKERAEAIEKAPSLFQPKKQGGYNQVF